MTLALAGSLGTAGTADAAHRHRHHGDTFVQTNLASDIPGLAAVTDPHLVNPWGIAFGPTTPLWTSNQGDNTSTLYTGTGAANAQKLPLVVDAASPTGIAFNPTSAFVVTQGGVSAPARFLFTENVFSADPTVPPTASITGWHTGTSTAPGSTGRPGAFYAGLALVPARHHRGPLLLAANAAPGGGIDVYDAAFQPVTRSPRHAFVDPGIDANQTPPYNVAYLHGRVYVAYAPSFGDPFESAVSVFSRTGRFRERLVTGHGLDGPWGMAIAPHEWGDFGGDLLVGNVFDGTINAYDRHSGRFQGSVDGPDGKPLVNLGLWGIAFGNGVIGTRHQLVLAAGIGTSPTSFDEVYEHGLVALVSPAHHGDHDD